MDPLQLTPAAIAEPTAQHLALSGSWTALGLRYTDRDDVGDRRDRRHAHARHRAAQYAGGAETHRAADRPAAAHLVRRRARRLERFAKAISATAYLSGLFKAPVFAICIAVIGYFQGFRTAGGADCVGRQTTRSVVQTTFLVILADALFSVALSALDR